METEEKLKEEDEYMQFCERKNEPPEFEVLEIIRSAHLSGQAHQRKTDVEMANSYREKERDLQAKSVSVAGSIAAAI